MDTFHSTPDDTRYTWNMPQNLVVGTGGRTAALMAAPPRRLTAAEQAAALRTSEQYGAGMHPASMYGNEYRYGGR